MKKIIQLTLFTFGFLVSISSIAQKREVHGQVTAEDETPLFGVSVVEKGTTNGVVTDSNGNFSIQIPDCKQRA